MLMGHWWDNLYNNLQSNRANFAMVLGVVGAVQNLVKKCDFLIQLSHNCPANDVCE